MQTSIIINTTLGGDKKQHTVTNVNPQATANNLITLSQKMTALSSETYVKTIRIDKTELSWSEVNNNG